MEVVLSSWVPCDRGPVAVGGELSNDGAQPTSGRLVVDYRPTQLRVVVGHYPSQNLMLPVQMKSE